MALVTFFRADNRDAGLLCESLGSGGRRAVLEGNLPRGPGQLLLGVGLARQHAFDQHGQPARRGVSGQFGRLGKQPLAREQVVDAAAQLGLGPGNHAGRNLFQPNLQQKISHNFEVLSAIQNR